MTQTGEPEQSASVTCSMCGRSEPEQPLTWTTSVERGASKLYCDKCSRDNVRAIEGKLDSDWW